MRVGVVGYGVIGRRRALVAQRAGDEVVIAADVAPERGRQAADETGCIATQDWAAVVQREDLDAICVATTNDWLAPVALKALESGKHVLCEKPMGRTPEECRRLVTAARESARVLKCGFNHRHKAALVRAHALWSEGAIGELAFIRARYGHGGRRGMEKEWRCDPEIAGGGEMLDQGIHVVDLCRWFAGDFSEAFGFSDTAVWLPGGDRSVEDNAFALFRTRHGRTASVHASWTQWKNLFSFEVFGTHGYLSVEGLGGSYGPSALIAGRRRSESGPPVESRFEFDDQDRSWDAEWDEFKASIREERLPLGSGEDALAAMRMVFAVYEAAGTGTVVSLNGPAGDTRDG